MQGAEADARSDLFSFGCVLYEMVTGRRAFEGKSQLGVLPPFWRKIREPIGIAQPMLERVIRECLIKDPAERFQSAHDVRWTCDGSRAPQAVKKKPNREVQKSSLILLAVAALAVVVALAGLAGYWSKRGDTGSADPCGNPSSREIFIRRNRRQWRHAGTVTAGREDCLRGSFRGRQVAVDTVAGRDAAQNSTARKARCILSGRRMDRSSDFSPMGS